MPPPYGPLTLAPADLQELERLLSELRHNINNNLSLIVAATELIRRKPEIAARMMETIAQQPPKVLNELKVFSDRVEAILQIVKQPQ
jgi:two-component sensor histidine kinase